MTKAKIPDYIPTWSEQVIEDQQGQITQLKADLAKLEQDGKRLDWLKRQVSVSDVCSHLDWDFNTGQSLFW